MFEKFDPRNDICVQLLDAEGKLTALANQSNIMSDDLAVYAYKTMIQARVANELAISLNRQGLLPTITPNQGQEANSVGALMAIAPDDWFVQTFRELGGLLTRKIPLRNYFLSMLGNEMGNFIKKEYYTLPTSIPIASQCLHAVGLAFAENYQKSSRISLSFVGDGGTSEGDFYEALNFAGIWNAPTIFYIQNNGWAISLPRSAQTLSKTLAEKAFAAGVEGVQIDGNDIFAVYHITQLAAQKARNKQGPTVIEGVTYRLGAHTTADDPTRYRSNEEVKEWSQKDPILRLEKYLLEKKLLDNKLILEIKTAAQSFASSEFEIARQIPGPSIDDTFKYIYQEMPPILSEQLAEFKLRNEIF